MLVTLGGRVELLIGVDSGRTSFPAAMLAAHKRLARAVLEDSGVPMPDGHAFQRGSYEEAISFAETRPGPWVIKPCLPPGLGRIRFGLSGAEEVAEVMSFDARGRHAGAELLIERQVEGRELRIFVAANGEHAAFEKHPPEVTGDGARTIAELVAAINVLRARLGRAGAGRIEIDREATLHLARAGFDADSIPGLGERVVLSRHRSVSAGAVLEDVTGAVAPELVALASRAIAAFVGLRHASVDLVVPSAVPSDPSSGDPLVLEIDPSPRIAELMEPGIGPGRDVARMIAGGIFSS